MAAPHRRTRRALARRLTGIRFRPRGGVLDSSRAGVPAPADLAMEPRSDRPPPASAAGVRLVQLGRGERARMAAADLERDECQLLHALGLTDRCLLQVCKPGDPCIVQVHATRIGLSQRLAEKILVVPAEER